MAEYLRTDKLVRLGCKDDFGGSIPAEAVTRLVDRGVLQGKTVRGKQMVLDDDALQRILRLGIEPFAFNQQGWSFAAVEADIDRVGDVMRQVFDVKEARQRVPVRKMGKVDPLPREGLRPLFLLKPAASNWALLVVRLNWFDYPSDWTIAETVAREASKRLKTRALAAAEHDVSGASAQEWRNGKSVEQWSDQEDDDFYVRFYDRGIAAPSCWVAFKDGKYVLMSDGGDAIERADFFG